MNAKPARRCCGLVQAIAASFVPSGPLNALRFRCRRAVHPPLNLPKSPEPVEGEPAAVTGKVLSDNAWKRLDV